jgi:hypothetical protein
MTEWEDGQDGRGEFKPAFFLMIIRFLAILFIPPFLIQLVQRPHAGEWGKNCHSGQKLPFGSHLNGS